MSRNKMLMLVAAVGLVMAIVAVIPASAGPPRKVVICHKPGTPAQKTMSVPRQAVPGHLGHGDYLGPCDSIIDADGTASSGRGISPVTLQVSPGDSLTSWPTGFYVEGIDWFDNDGTCTWTLGDDIHVEGPAHPTAFRNALHDANPIFFDPVVLDLDGSFFDGQPVDVDLESGSAFSGCPGVDPLLKFYDADGNIFWDNGEDIVLDRNNNGVYD
jgi:hypothetical protein